MIQNRSPVTILKKEDSGGGDFASHELALCSDLVAAEIDAGEQVFGRQRNHAPEEVRHERYNFQSAKRAKVCNNEQLVKEETKQHKE